MEMQGNVQLQGAMFSSDHDEDAFELKLIFNKTKYKYLCLDLWKQCQRKPSPESIKTKKKRKEIQNICQSLFSSTRIFLSSIIFSIILSGSEAFRSCEIKAVGHLVQKNTVLIITIIKYKMLYCPLTFYFSQRVEISANLWNSIDIQFCRNCCILISKCTYFDGHVLQTL